MAVNSNYQACVLGPWQGGCGGGGGGGGVPVAEDNRGQKGRSGGSVKERPEEEKDCTFYRKKVKIMVV